MIDVQVDVNKVIERWDNLVFFQRQLPAYLQTAVQDTLDEGRELLVDELEQAINAPREVLNTRVGRTMARNPVRPRYEGDIFIKATPIALKVFSPRQGEKGVYYRPYRSGSTKFVRGAFGPDIRRLGRGVYKRQGRKRLPIQRESGLSLADDPIAMGAVDAASAQMDGLLWENVDEQITNLYNDMNAGVDRQYRGGVAVKSNTFGDAGQIVRGRRM